MLTINDFRRRYLDKSPIKWKEIGFVMLPHRILFDERLKSSDLMVYWILLVHQFKGKEYCYPSQKLIATETKLSLRTVSRAIKRLEASGWIDIDRKEGTTCRYYVRSHSQKTLL